MNRRPVLAALIAPLLVLGGPALAADKVRRVLRELRDSRE